MELNDLPGDFFSKLGLKVDRDALSRLLGPGGVLPPLSFAPSVSEANPFVSPRQLAEAILREARQIAKLPMNLHAR
jgi:hypothetical protein